MDWDFRGADTRRLTHGIHVYPAVMVPQVAARLIGMYGVGGRRLLDPFCGSGTSLLEGSLVGLEVVGADLNPLARLIARVKTRSLELGGLRRVVEGVEGVLLREGFCGRGGFVVPEVRNVDFWFSGSVQRGLGLVREVLCGVGDVCVREFLEVAFSETVRECSFTRNGEFKVYRMSEGQRRGFAPDVVGVFLGKVRRNLGAMERLVGVGVRGGVVVDSFDCVEGVPEGVGLFDLVVSSPPYGDSRTTVAYGQFSRFANEWLGLGVGSELDGRLMGGGRGGGDWRVVNGGFGCAALDEALGRVAALDGRRAGEVGWFFADYRRAVGHVGSVVRRGGVVCFVVGNRRVRGVELPMACATRCFFEGCGFGFVGLFERGIPNKRMPSRNSPSNVRGVTGGTMCREFIVVMRRL